MSNNITLIPKKPVRHTLLTDTDYVVYMPLASKFSHGIVKIGDGLNITTDGLLTVDFTADWYSGVKTDVEQLKVDVNSVKTDIGELVVSLDNFEEVLRNYDTRIDNNANAIASKIDSTYLQNYYTKAETYNKQEINKLIVPAQGLRKEIVDVLPEAGEDNILYMVPKVDASGSDYYDEYLYINGRYEFVGTTQTSLEGYVTIEDFNKLVNNETQISGADGRFKAGGATSASKYSVAIGQNSIAEGTGGIAVGVNSKAIQFGGNSGIAIGNNAEASAQGIAIGANAKGTGSKSIQIGQGSNLKSGTLQICNDNIYNHETHTLTVQNIELNGVDLGTQLGDLNTALETILGV